MNWMMLPLRRYVEFGGRSSRMEYWMFQLFRLISLILLVSTSFLFEDDAYLFVVGLWFLSLAIPQLALTVRRYHDQARPAWFLLFRLIPTLGLLIEIGFMCVRGTDGDNDYGPPAPAPGSLR